jgi:hypothetical protein
LQVISALTAGPSRSDPVPYIGTTALKQICSTHVRNDPQRTLKQQARAATACRPMRNGLRRSRVRQSRSIGGWRAFGITSSTGRYGLILCLNASAIAF